MPPASLKPLAAAEIAYAEWTQNDLLRQPRFEGLRPDKKPRDVRRERAAPAPAAAIPDEQPATERDDAMPLTEYQAKRNFRKTPEPSGAPARGHRRPIFVVQEHHASRLHYDFRLEADGVLKSWAVPKAPSLDPATKRLAVRVEDHPLAYATFHGTIPEGQYGAGKVSIWDHGAYENLKGDTRDVPDGIEAGRLEFALHGEKLKGKFALIRMAGRRGKKENWLLIKMRDEQARPDSDGAKVKKAPAARRTRSKATTAARPARDAAPAPDDVAVTRADKVLFPEAGFTKGDVFAYYDRVADALLPFLRDRPATLERSPDGIGEGKPRFWQKNTPAYYPDWIARANLPSEAGKPVHYALINDRESLLYLVNQGTLTFHVWLSRVGDPDRPDWVLFDLDPGGADFADVVAVARRLHRELENEGLEAFVKTSGKTGLHVLTRWTGGGGYDESRALARSIAERVTKLMPDRVTLEIRKEKRTKRVYIDVLQNARGHTVVPPYALRALPAATVSAPLRWPELTPGLDPARFTLKTLPRRLADRGGDPLAALVK
jgi:bifunctional non-homologous end joining protein LigD